MQKYAITIKFAVPNIQKNYFTIFSGKKK